VKRTHIIAIIIIAISVAAILGSLSDSSTYADFGEAFAHPDREFHVVGELNRDKPAEYQPEINPDLFTFYMVDKTGQERKVVLHSNRPQDFEKSEQIVVIGQAQGEDFHANQMLLKCPSKYEEGNPENTTVAQ
jgi:cytochrome c-type biogenesis protein CcmE